MKDESLWDFDRLKADKLQGVFVINEGNFTYGNASLSFYDKVVRIDIKHTHTHDVTIKLQVVVELLCIAHYLQTGAEMLRCVLQLWTCVFV